MYVFINLIWDNINDAILPCDGTMRWHVAWLLLIISDACLMIMTMVSVCGGDDANVDVDNNGI
jgi:hypothetical protein